MAPPAGGGMGARTRASVRAVLAGPHSPRPWKDEGSNGNSSGGGGGGTGAAASAAARGRSATLLVLLLLGVVAVCTFGPGMHGGQGGGSVGSSGVTHQLVLRKGGGHLAGDLSRRMDGDGGADGLTASLINGTAPQLGNSRHSRQHGGGGVGGAGGGLAGGGSVILLPGTEAALIGHGLHCIPPGRETDWSSAAVDGGGATEEEEQQQGARRRLLTDGKSSSSSSSSSSGSGTESRRAARITKASAGDASDKPAGPEEEEDEKDGGRNNKEKKRKPFGEFTVALVNDVAFHHEVTLGLTAALRPMLGGRLTVYLHKSLFEAPAGPGKDGGGNGTAAAAAGGHGLLEYARAALNGSSAGAGAAPGAPRLMNAYDKAGIRPADVAVLASPEFSVDYAREFIAASRPRMVIVFVHEPRMELRRLRYLVSLHPFTGIAALSPHVAATLTRRLNGAHTHWMLPTHDAGCRNGCVEGFSVQGKFEASRRTYGALWRDMLAVWKRSKGEAEEEEQEEEEAPPGGAAGISGSGNATSSSSSSSSNNQPQGRRRRLADTTAADTTAAASAPPPSPPPRPPLPRVNVVGSGDLSALRLPRALQGSVFVYRGLGYADYFDTLCRSAALLPLFNEASGYLRDKISSSVLASLSAGAPLVAPGQFLDAYPHFSKGHVLLMEPGETEVAAMARLMARPDLPALLLERRTALRQLQRRLNSEAAAKLEGLMRAAEGKPRHGGTQPPLPPKQSSSGSSSSSSSRA